MPETTITRLTPGHPAVPEYARLRKCMWEIDPALNNEEVEQIVADADDWAVFIASAEGGAGVGFIEVWLREYAEGASSSPVGYVEGWYVEPDFRCRGIGRMLIEAGEDWARSRGCTEMASDTEVDNAGAIHAHQHLGYTEVSRNVHFLKEL